MLRKLRPRSAYDVMAALTLFLVVTGGTAFAVVAANQVNSASIIDGQVKSQDIANSSIGPFKIKPAGVANSNLGPGSVDSPKVLDNSLGGQDVLDNSLGGNDILESSLGQVPSAANADTLNGKSSTAFLGATAKAADADKLDGRDSLDFAAKNGNSTDKLGYDVQSIDMSTTGSNFGFGRFLTIRTAGTSNAPAMKVCASAQGTSQEVFSVTTIIAGVRSTNVITTGIHGEISCTAAKAVAKASEFQIFGTGVVVFGSPTRTTSGTSHQTVGLMS